MIGLNSQLSLQETPGRELDESMDLSIWEVADCKAGDTGLLHGIKCAHHV